MAKPTKALSVRQPYAELIMQGKKKIEYRSIRTNIIGERIYIYASRQFAVSENSEKAWRKVKTEPKDLPRGVLIGTVIIKECSDEQNVDGYYEWHLIEPERLPKNKAPKNPGQPVWFKPF
jgi:hypothetical protein